MTSARSRRVFTNAGDALVTSPLRSSVEGLLQLLWGAVAGEAVPAVLAADVARIGTVLVTGCNCGLGRAIAVRLVRGGTRRLLMACRDDVPAARDDVRARAGVPDADVAIDYVDLADLRTVHALCDALRDRGERIDVLVLNAGVVTARARRSADGLDTMLQVNYLANTVLVRRLLHDGVLRCADPAPDTCRPRIVLVSSEDHRHPTRVDLDAFATFRDYNTAFDLSMYGESKLYLTTYAWELSRRLNRGRSAGDARVAVLAMCPGPVNSNIANEAPAWIKPLVQLMFRLLFRDPLDAALPGVYLAAASALEGRTQVYMHRFAEKPPAPLVFDKAFARALWDTSEDVVAAVTGRARGAHPVALLDE